MKKIISFVMALALIACLTVPFFAGKDSRGDINYDGDVTVVDAILAFQHVAGKTDLTADDSKTDAFSADIDQNGFIEVDDAIKIFQYVAGKLPAFPALVG